MRTPQLRAFNAVARLGGFSNAAQWLNLTQPAVTIQVRSLEDTYGLKLFSRRGGVVTLTEAGRGLYERTQDLFSAEDRVRDYLDKSETLALGDLRISADGPHVVMAVIGAFRERYPAVRMSVTLGNAHTVWHDLLEGAADVVVVANPPKEKRAHIVDLGYRGLNVLLPPDHLLAKKALPEKTGLALRALAGEDVIYREPQSNTQKSLIQALKKNKTQLNGILELSSREGVIEAVAAGLGLGFVFDGEVPADSRVVRRAVAGCERENRDTVACLNSQTHRNSVKAFLKVAADWRAETQLFAG